MTDELNPLDLVEAYEGRAGLLCRCILYGLLEPDVEITPGVQATLAQSMVEELTETFNENESMFLSRAKRAFKWTVREDVPAEFGIIVGQQITAMISGERTPELFETDEYAAYREKFAAIITDAAK